MREGDDMLQMICPNCNGVVSSQFLVDVSSTECSQCNESIPVKDIFISTPYLTINREDFLNQINRFKRLLGEVENERLLVAGDKGASTKRIKSLEQFHLSLNELLDGARNNYRIELPVNLFVEVTDTNRILRGKLLNICTEGCSIELLMLDTTPRIDSVLSIEFFFPKLAEILASRARVVWTKEQINENGVNRATIGTSFVAMEEATRRCIWNYIMDNAPVPFQQMSS